MYLTILSPEKKIFEGKVTQVTLPGSEGSFQVLKNHAPLVSLLVQGTLVYETEAERKALPIAGGVLEVVENRLVVLLYTGVACSTS